MYENRLIKVRTQRSFCVMFKYKKRRLIKVYFMFNFFACVKSYLSLQKHVPNNLYELLSNFLRFNTFPYSKRRKSFFQAFLIFSKRRTNITKTVPNLQTQYIKYTLKCCNKCMNVLPCEMSLRARAQPGLCSSRADRSAASCLM